LSLDAECLRALELAAHWFVESGIQEPSGGVARYYQCEPARNYRISTEITGYAASTLVWLYRLSGDERLREAGLRAGHFLISRAWDASSGLFPFECALDGDCAEPLAYFFDNAIVVRGLLALWKLTGEPQFLSAAQRVGAAMAREFRSEVGFHPALRLPERLPAPSDGRWSRSPGCYHLKAALAWLELDQAFAGGAFRQYYRRALEFALATHREFLGERPEPAVMDRLHAYCYFLEGLLAALDQPECRQAAKEGIVRAYGMLEAVAPQFERCDVRAQLLRVRVFLDAQGIVPLHPEEAERQAARILEFQALEPDPRYYGGFRFGRRGSEWLPFINPYSTAFAAQALEMWRAHRAGRFQSVWQDLI